MKTQEEIEQLVYSCFGEKEWTNVSTNAKLSLIQTYTQCQEDMLKLMKDYQAWIFATTDTLTSFKKWLEFNKQD